MARPPKSFTVEVKRGRKSGAASVFAAQPASAPAPEPRPSAAVLRPREESPQRRILDAIVPEPVLPQVEAEIVARPRRGRPPKSAGASRKHVADPQTVEPQFLEPDLAPVAAPAPAAPTLPPPRPAQPAQRRRAEATDLPRGERWKRRMSKVLW